MSNQDTISQDSCSSPSSSSSSSSSVSSVNLISSSSPDSSTATSTSSGHSKNTNAESDHSSQGTQGKAKFVSDSIGLKEGPISAEKRQEYRKICQDLKDLYQKKILDIEKKNNILTLHDFLMSCRVFGRKIEYAIIDYIYKYALNSSCKELKINFKVSESNKSSTEFLSSITIGHKFNKDLLDLDHKLKIKK